MIRAWLIALAGVLIALVGPAAAQTGENDVAAVAAALQSDNLVVRQRAAREIERRPGVYPPILLLVLPRVLEEFGRSEDALQWQYFAQLRLLTDVRLVASTTGQSFDQTAAARRFFAPLEIGAATIAPARRRALLEAAIRLDARTPRLYAMNAGMGFGGPPAAWPSVEAISTARFASANQLRADLEQAIERDAAIAAIDAEIAGGAPAAESAAYIPEPLRTRVTPLRTVRLSAECEQPVAVTPTPLGAQPSAFLLACESILAWLTPQGPGRLAWYASSDLQVLGGSTRPDGFFNNQIVARGGAPFALFRATPGTDAMLIGVDGKVSVMPTMSSVATAVSPSGRYVLRRGVGGVEVWDVETNTVLFTRETRTQTVADGATWEQVKLIIEPAPGQLQLVSVRGRSCRAEAGTCVGELLVIDAPSGRTRQVTASGITAGSEATPSGRGRVMVGLIAPPAQQSAPTAEVSTYENVEAWRAAQQAAQQAAAPTAPAEQHVAIVDVEAMRVEWTGPRAQAPPPQGVFRCAPERSRPYYRGRDGNPAALSLTLDQQTGALLTPARGAAAHCAVSADGARLVVLAPPFLHLYALGAP